MTPVRSWGGLSADLHRCIPLQDPFSVPRALQVNRVHGPGLAYGNGRSYGDVGLNPGGTIFQTRGLNCLAEWDSHTGVLCCEAGVLLQDIQRAFVSQGWMLPVTPGTLLVTVGGAIANDVHGKNHHLQGSFGDHVLRLWLARSDGSVTVCSPEQAPNLYAATIGGIGLTGVIVKAELQLKRVAGPWLETESLPFRGLSEFFNLSQLSEPVWEQTVAWIDCLSTRGGDIRGIYMRANPSVDKCDIPRAKREKRFMLTPNFSLVNRWSLKPFNEMYYWLQRSQSGVQIKHYEDFSYPLDGLHDWNRMYGASGFYQYQSVVPPAQAHDATKAMLEEIAKSGEGSFLAVLKMFGQRFSRGMLGFARPGTTLALDFPNRGESTQSLFRRLDAIVKEAGGALYLAKDARMPRSLFEATYPRLSEWMVWRDKGLSSGMSRRLMGS